MNSRTGFVILSFLGFIGFLVYYSQWEITELTSRFQVGEYRSQQLETQVDKLAELLDSRQGELADLFLKQQQKLNKRQDLVESAEYFLSDKCSLRNLSSNDKFIIVTRAKQEATWIRKLGIPYILYDKGIFPLQLDHYEKNKENIVFSPFDFAVEVTGYLQFMIEYYNCLPLRTLFLHGHHEEEHPRKYGGPKWFPHVNYTDELIERVCWDKIDNFFSLSKRVSGYERESKNLFPIWDCLWDKHGLTPIFGELPSPLYFHCCAQFIVHRDTIRRHPREKWLALFHALLTTDDSCRPGYPISYTWGRLLEHLWEHLFGVTEHLRGLHRYFWGRGDPLPEGAVQPEVYVSCGPEGLVIVPPTPGR